MKSGFAERKGKQLIPTQNGAALVSVLPDMLTSPQLTAEWENNLTQIAKGAADAGEFMQRIEAMTWELVKENTAAEGKGNFPFLKETVVFPHGKGAIPVRTVEIFLSLMDGATTTGAFPDRGLFFPTRENCLAFVGGGVLLYQLPRHSFNALHELPSVGVGKEYPFP